MSQKTEEKNVKKEKKSKDYNDDNSTNIGVRSFYKLSENRYK